MDDSTTNFKIIVPLTIGPDIDSLDNSLYSKAIQNVITESHLIDFIEIGKDRFCPTAQLLTNYNPKTHPDVNVYAIQFTVDIPVEVQKIEFPFGLGHDYYHASLITKKLALQTNYFLTLSTIVYPKFIQTYNVEIFGGPLIFYPGFKITNILYNPYISDIEEKISPSWPKFENITLTETWNWQKSLDIDLEGVSKNSVHRALFALTYVFGEEVGSDSSQILWSMFGIEALFVPESNRVLRQLKTRIPTILQHLDSKSFNSLFDQLYGHRSKYGHGSMNIFPKYYGKATDKSFWNHHYSNENESRKALEILIGSLQKMIQNNVIDFNWKKISNKNPTKEDINWLIQEVESSRNQTPLTIDQRRLFYDMCKAIIIRFSRFDDPVLIEIGSIYLKNMLNHPDLTFEL